MKLSLGDGKSYKPSMKNCDRCGKLLRDEELRVYEYQSIKHRDHGRFCVRCWYLCALEMERYPIKIRDFFFPLSKWDNYKKFKAAKSLEHKDQSPTNLA